jgi:hypothetical protein
MRCRHGAALARRQRPRRRLTGAIVRAFEQRGRRAVRWRSVRRPLSGRVLRALGVTPISVVVLYAIPTDPQWVPDADHEAAAVAVFGRQVPHDGDIEVIREGGVRFYDAGEGFETARCPVCRTIVAVNPSDMGWLVEQFDLCSSEAGFWPIDAVAPCCEAVVSLNDLDYQWPQGFASWSMGAVNAQTWELAEPERRVGNRTRSFRATCVRPLLTSFGPEGRGLVARKRFFEQTASALRRA